MPQLSLYLDDPMMEGLRQDASREGKTLSNCEDGVLVEPPDEPFDLDPIPALELA